MMDETEKFIELQRRKSFLEEEARNSNIEAQFKIGELICGDIIKALKGGIGGSVDIPLAYKVRARAMDLKKLRDDSRNIDIGVDDIVDRVTSGYGSDEGD